ncbi:LamG domain-containing protein, partial [Microbacterium sp. BF1]
PDFPFTSPVLSTNVATAGYEITSLGAPVDASQSFTFSLWVKPAHIASTSQVVAIQSGQGVGTMQLQITSTGKYAFCLGDRYVNMSNTARDNNCVAGGTVTPGSWQMVTGIWDGTNHQLRLHIGNSTTPVAVNGHVNGSGDRTANGGLMFAPGPDSLRFIGLITNPVVVPGVINHAQLERLTAFELPFTD